MEYTYFNNSDKVGFRLLIHNNSTIRIQKFRVVITFSSYYDRCCSICSLSYRDCRDKRPSEGLCASLHKYLNGAYLKYIELKGEYIIKLSLFTSLILLKLVNEYEKGRFIKIKTGK